MLFWGIVGALITRGLFIAIGAALLANFHFVMYIFGAFLIFTAVRLMRGGDEEPHPEKNPVLPAVPPLRPHHARSTSAPASSRARTASCYATPLLMVLVVIEATDVVFAVDSIPAVFGVTSDVFIVYTSNIFAVLGLRALCFLVASVVAPPALPAAGAGAGAGVRRRQDAGVGPLPHPELGLAAGHRAA